MFPFKICKNDLKSFNQTRAALHTLTSSVLNSKQNLSFLKGNPTFFFLQTIANVIYMSKNVWFSFPNTAHTVLIGHKVILPIYSGNSSWRHSLITAQGSPTSPQTPWYPAEVSGRIYELSSRLGKQ